MKDEIETSIEVTNNEKTEGEKSKKKKWTGPLTLRKELYFRKRGKELNQRYLEGQDLLNMKDFINKHIYFYRNFEPVFKVEPGEIYYAEFPVGFGSEIHGRHPVVVLTRSGVKCPIMSVVPLTSKGVNTVSDYDLGVIKGLSKNNEHSVAVINQTRGIDKRRLVVESCIDILKSRQEENPSKKGSEIRVDSFRISRLPREKLKKLKELVRKYMDEGELK